jgi:signal transduction histidine kinase
VRVLYPIEDGRFVDENGEPVEAPRTSGGRASTTILRGDTLIAIVEHGADLDATLLDREIGAAARLAVDNERLDATIRARLLELQESRARVVEAGDAARGGLERDLHYSAQQRLLAVSFECRLALAALPASETTQDVRAALAASLGEIDSALADLRELAHGIHPVILSEDGLTGALRSLADGSAVPLRLVGEVGRCSSASELAAYLAAVEALRRAESAGADWLIIETRSVHGGLDLRIRGRGIVGDASWLRTEDRVGAAGGRMSLDTAADGLGELRMELPCA